MTSTALACLTVRVPACLAELMAPATTLWAWLLASVTPAGAVMLVTLALRDIIPRAAIVLSIQPVAITPAADTVAVTPRAARPSVLARPLTREIIAKIAPPDTRTMMLTVLAWPTALHRASTVAITESAATIAGRPCAVVQLNTPGPSVTNVPLVTKTTTKTAVALQIVPISTAMTTGLAQTPVEQLCASAMPNTLATIA